MERLLERLAPQHPAAIPSSDPRGHSWPSSSLDLTEAPPEALAPFSGENTEAL